MKKNRCCDDVKSLFYQILRKMKLTLLLLFVSVLTGIAADSYSQSTKMTLKLENVRIEDLLNKIEDQSQFRFFYNEEINLDEKVSIDVSTETIANILEKVFAEKKIQYEIIGRQIILSNGVNSNITSGQQQKSVSGKVTDSSGATLPGVSVVVKGTTTGVITDSDGNYTFSNIPKGAILQFTFVGMKMQQIEVNGKSIVDVTLLDEIVGIEEVVAIGYGSQSKRIVTGSIASSDMKALENLPITNVSQALRGRIAGVQFIDNGRPGQGGNILIRGQRSISANNNPLIILDGAPFNGNLADINSNDVQSMDVLKDASASAIYGSRAANGVIIITTKKGTTEKPIVSFNAYHAFSSPAKLVKILSPERYIQKTLDYRAAYGLEADPSKISSYLQTSEAENYAAGKTVNPWDAISQSAYTSSYDLSVSARSKNTSFYVSGNIADEKGIIYNDNSKRISFKTNIETKVTQAITFGISSQFSNRNLSGANPDVNVASFLSPYSTLYDSNGIPTQFAVREDQLTGNPLWGVWFNKNEEIYQNVFANLYTIVDLPFIKGLQFRINYSPNFRWGHNYNFTKQDPRLTNNMTRASKFNQYNMDWTLENILTYNFRINENNKLDLTLLYGRNHSEFNSTTSTGITFPTDVVTWNNLGQANTQSVSSFASAQEGLSSMARINYRFKDKYLITLTGRRDGASVFAKNNKFAFFPSGALSWIVSDESFLKNVESLNLLKFRVSYGAVGNQAINPYQSLSLTNTTQYVFGDGGSTSVGIYSANMGNSNLKWETTYSSNIAVDFKMLKNRISGTLEYYNLDTKNLILLRSLPLMTGYSNVLVNLGQTRNSGLEFTLNTINIQKKDFEWRSDITFSMNKNEIKHIYNSDVNNDGIEDNDLGNNWFIGSPIRVAYNYVFDGIYQTGDVMPAGYKAGMIRMKDLNGDGLFTPDKDRRIIGNLDPKFRWSFNNEFTYKNFTFSMLINSMQGWISNFGSAVGFDASNFGKPINLVDFDWWTPSHPSNTGPSFNATYPLGTSFYESRDFIRLQDVSLSYNFPKNLLQKYKLDGLRIYASGRNLYTWTKWKGTDPESGQGRFPISRTGSLGLSLSF